VPLTSSGAPAPRVPCKILGIVNVTRDSFSDGGRYFDPDAAIAHARALVDAGASMIDLGPASSHPDAETVGAEEEIRRLTPVVKALADVPLSIDTYLPQTQRWAMDAGVHALNDIQGFPDSAFYPTLASGSCDLVLMHSIQRRGKATRADSDPGTIFGELTQFFDERVAALERAGVERARLILDPGMGFFLGRDPESSLTVLRRMPELRERYGLPVLISVSRKSFLRRITGCSLEQSGAPTLAAELYCAAQGVDWIRTHDVASLTNALRVQASLAG
jgi:dihydropteroate synthase type 2